MVPLLFVFRERTVCRAPKDSQDVKGTEVEGWVTTSLWFYSFLNNITDFYWWSGWCRVTRAGQESQACPENPEIQDTGWVSSSSSSSSFTSESRPQRTSSVIWELKLFCKTMEITAEMQINLVWSKKIEASNVHQTVASNHSKVQMFNRTWYRNMSGFSPRSEEDTSNKVQSNQVDFQTH